MSTQRLQLTWHNKDKALIPTETGGLDRKLWTRAA